MVSKKEQLLEAIFNHCLAEGGDMSFDNDLVKRLSLDFDFKNHNDTVKLDETNDLLPVMKQNDYGLVHLGKGRHRFVRGISSLYHEFEPIEMKEIPWDYNPGVLNGINDSESNALSMIFNQRIVQHFLYQDNATNPKIYNAHRTHANLRYSVAKTEIVATKVQMEIDFTCEYQGRVTVFEAKTGAPKDFAVNQIFSPYLNYLNMKENENLPIKSIDCCYVLKCKGDDLVKMYLYGFEGREITSLKLKKARAYRLQRNV